MEKQGKNHPIEELPDEEITYIRDLFFSEIEPRLMKIDARMGNISCAFAGEKYCNWIIEFRSLSNGFEIVDISYDPDADTIDIDL